MATLADSLTALAAAYPRQNFPDDTVAIYARMLGDLDPDCVMDAVKRLIARSRFMPTIAEIREDVAEARAMLPSAAEAWEIMLRGDLANAAPEIQAAARSVGGRHAIQATTNPTAVRAQFDRDYADRRANAIHQIAGAAVPRDLTALAAGTVRMIPAASEERIRPRPIMQRLLARMSGLEPGAPSDADISDAITVLHDHHPGDEPDPLLNEATMILDRYGR